MANEACDGEHVSVNGKRAKASYDVKVGDKITVSLGQSSKTIEVLEINEHTLKENAPSMYKIIS